MTEQPRLLWLAVWRSTCWFVQSCVEPCGGAGSGSGQALKLCRLIPFQSMSERAKPLSLLPLIALIFYDVSGGPFGIEVCAPWCDGSAALQRSVCATASACTRLQDAVSKGAPLLAVLGFVILPFIWSVPEALVTAGTLCAGCCSAAAAAATACAASCLPALQGPAQSELLALLQSSPPLSPRTAATWRGSLPLLARSGASRWETMRASCCLY